MNQCTLIELLGQAGGSEAGEICREYLLRLALSMNGGIPTEARVFRPTERQTVHSICKHQ